MARKAERVVEPQPNTKVMIEEYKALRAEVLLAIDTSIKTITFLLAALSALVAAGATARSKNEELAALIFAVLVPAASAFGIWMWLGEVHRLRRDSVYLSYIEPRLGIGWEAWLRDKDPGGGLKRLFFQNHQATYWFLAGAGFGSFVYGLWLLVSLLIGLNLCSNLHATTVRIVCWIVGAVVGGVVFIWWSRKGWTRIRQLEKDENFGRGPKEQANGGYLKQLVDAQQKQIAELQTEIAYLKQLIVHRQTPK